MDLNAALSVARGEVVRGEEVMGEVLGKLETPTEAVEERPLPALSLIVPAPVPRTSFWGRLLGRKREPGCPVEAVADQQQAIDVWQQHVAQQGEQLRALRQDRAEIRNAAGHVRRFVDSMVTGYTMSLQ